MLTKVTVRNFKLFEEAEVELADRVVFVGPNNSGKTSVLQALALWELGAKRWLEKRGSRSVPKERSGVAIGRRDLIAVPVPSANLLWRDLHVRSGRRENGKARTQNVLIEITVSGVSGGETWKLGLEFDYANEESFYCRPLRTQAGEAFQIPEAVRDLNLAYLPPMSGLAAAETKLDAGAINVRIGEGRTAEVLRNLCYRVVESEHGESKWKELRDQLHALFGIVLTPPEYVKERGEIVLGFRTRSGTLLDISSGGRGQQQTLLLLAHMTANPGAVLLLDEPDAHLEILRQRQIYQVLSSMAANTGSQIIAASHSEVLLNEAAGRDVVVAFVGAPHRIDNRGNQVLKALRDIGFDHYVQAEETGWVVYLEGSTDLALLQAFARKTGHQAAKVLERPFVQYVANQPRKAQEHFHGLREAKPDLAGIAVYDRLEAVLPFDPNLRQYTWRKREFENYLCQRETLMAFADAQGRAQHGDLFGESWKKTMEAAVDEIEKALADLGKPDPWGPDIKASDDFLDPLFKKFYGMLRLPNLMSKTNYHEVAPFVAAERIDAEIVGVLDLISSTAAAARPRGSK